MYLGFMAIAVDVVPNDPYLSMDEPHHLRGRTFEPVSYSSSLKPARDIEKVPLAILVNSATASAAEIVSGAVQVDNERDGDVGKVLSCVLTFFAPMGLTGFR